MRTGRLFIGLAMLALVGCASGPEGKGGPFSTVKEDVPVEYTLVHAATGERPGWIDVPPEDSGDVHFLVGLSNHHATEQEARKEAMRDARNAFAAYTGVEVVDIDEMVQELYGSASGVLDATVSGTSRSTQAAEARVSRIKPKEWYWEKYHADQGGKDRGEAYRYWVLVTVPQDEYDRVQDWRRRKEAAAKEDRERIQASARAEAGEVLSVHRERQSKIEEAIAGADPMLALLLIQREWDRLDAATRRLKEEGGPFAEEASTVEIAQSGVLSLASAIRSAIWIDTGREGTVLIPPTGAPVEVPVWVWFKANGEHRPVPNIPLMLADEDGTPVDRTVTGHDGRAVFRPKALRSGRYLVGMDTGTAPMPDLNEALRKTVGTVEAPLAAVTYLANVQGATRAAVLRLFDGPAAEGLAATQVIMGPVTFGETGQGGPFAAALSRQIRLVLTQVPGLAVVEPRKRSAALLTRTARTRGIGQVAKAPMGSGAMQALMDGAQAALEASYNVYGDTVQLDLALRQAGTDRLLATSTADIAADLIPPGLAPVPEAPKAYRPPMPPSTGGVIELEITSSMGDGQTYEEGDPISFFVSSDRDAYLLLVYDDAKGNLIQILPNRDSGDGFFPAGVFFEVPDPAAGFEWKIEPPFGQEQVWAFAASKPFPGLKGTLLDNGLTLLDGPMDQVLRAVRGHGLAGGMYGEARTAIVTVETVTFSGGSQ